MSEDDVVSSAVARGRKPGRRVAVAFDPELGRAICERVAGGELFYDVCREPGMPTAQCVGVWSRKDAAFGAALSEARRAGGRAIRGGGVSTYTAEVADEIFERMCEGESLTAISRDPAMPCMSTLFYWRKRYAPFEEALQLATRIRAERFCDLGWELAMEATPETAYLTHVRLGQLRWTAGVMAPRVYRTKAVEPEQPPRVKRILFRHFQREVDPETGEPRVVGYCPNPETGLMEREDTPGYRPPPGIRMPAGGADQAGSEDLGAW
jgi:hypothetical protein